MENKYIFSLPNVIVAGYIITSLVVAYYCFFTEVSIINIVLAFIGFQFLLGINVFWNSILFRKQLWTFSNIIPNRVKYKDLLSIERTLNNLDEPFFSIRYTKGNNEKVVKIAERFFTKKKLLRKQFINSANEFLKKRLILNI